MAKRRRKATRRRPVSRFSTWELKQELAKRLDRIRELRKERAKLEKAIAAINRQIVELSGMKARGARKRKRIRVTGRKRTTRTQMKRLQTRVSKALSGSKKGMGIGELAQAVRAKTPQLRRVIKRLIQEKRVKKTGERRATRYFAVA